MFLLLLQYLLHRHLDARLLLKSVLMAVNTGNPEGISCEPKMKRNKRKTRINYWEILVLGVNFSEKMMIEQIFSHSDDISRNSLVSRS